MKARRNVALIVETESFYGRHILHGIARYQRVRGDWSIFLKGGARHISLPSWLLDGNIDGVICRSLTPELAELLLQHGLVTVDLNDRYHYLGLPRIISDMPAIGRMAAAHLLERGFRNLAFCGYENEVWSAGRLQGVEQELRGRGRLCSVFESTVDHWTWQQERQQIMAWLQTLPRPTGIITCNDVRGYHVLDACRALDIAVPEDLAVVGVDNAETFCDFCYPPLSSVVPDAERIGFEAAQLLDLLMEGHAPPFKELLIAPREIITRQSSDVMAVDDPTLASTLRFIREHACSGITVADVLTHAPLSRSALERGFRHFLGHSPQEEIRRVRLEKIKQLLAETAWPLAQIASETGFTSPESMMVQFKRVMGQTPSQWRQNHQINRLDIISNLTKNNS